MTLVAFGVVAFACLIALQGRRFARLLALAGVFSCIAAGAAAMQPPTVNILRPLITEQWNGWEDLGGVTARGPECLATQVNRIDCFVAIGGGLIVRKNWDGARWNGPTLIGGLELDSSFEARVECVTWAADHLDCFARRHPDGMVFQRTIHAGFMTGWQSLGGPITSDPECVSTRIERLDCFARGSNGSLIHNSFDGDMWSGWISRGGQILDRTKLSCVVFRGEPNCITVTNQNTLQHFRFAPTGVELRNMQGGAVLSSPKCYASPGLDLSAGFDDQIFCFAPKQTDLGRWNWTGAGNMSWSLSNIGGPLIGMDWDCVLRGPNDHVDCIELIPVTNPNSGNNTPVGIKLRHRSIEIGQGVTMSGDLLPLQNGAPTFIDCVSWAADRIDCFISGGNAPLLHSFLTPVSVIDRRIRRPNP